MLSLFTLFCSKELEISSDNSVLECCVCVFAVSIWCVQCVFGSWSVYLVCTLCIWYICVHCMFDVNNFTIIFRVTLKFERSFLIT